MKRIIDFNGDIHFNGAHYHTLCGLPNSEPNLLGERTWLMHEVSEPVTCPECAKLYCQIKNAPWNEVSDGAMENGMYSCGDNAWCGACGNGECPDRGKDIIKKCEKFVKEQ